jgi:hypothetical protein
VSPRVRRTNADLDRLFEAVVGLLASEDLPPTKRRLFYLLVAAGVIEKTEHAYKQLCEHTTKWCRDGRLSWGAFEAELDVRGADQYPGSLAEFLVRVAERVEKDLWDEQDAYAVIVCEKAGLANILLSAVAEYRVPVVSAGGFEGDVALFKFAEILKGHTAAGRTIHVGYFGDWDPSGVLIDGAAEETLRTHHDLDVRFERLAVTKAQIKELRLPTRPTKREGNAHAAGFEGESVEVDAVPTATLRELARDFVLRTIDLGRYEAALEAEETERAEVLKALEALR